MSENKLYIVKGQIKSSEPVITKYKIEEISQTICNRNISEKYYKEVPKSYYGEIQYDDEYFKRIEKMLSDDWEGDEEIFVPEEESSKPFNTPTILGCVESGDKKLFEAANDFETMYNESERVYNKDYSTGEYCHEQSFKWGFQEGVDWADKHPKRYSQEELCGIQLEMMRQRDKRFINKACKYLKSLTYQEFAGGPLVRVLDDDIINDFCKAMEE